MGNFFGTYTRNLDDKGRLQIPPKLLEGEEAKELYLLKGFDGCLSIYLRPDFEELIASLKRMDFHDESQRAYIRLAASSVQILPLDSHGRISLTKKTLDDYRIGKEVTILGVLDHFEIWDSAAYATYLFRYSGSYDYLAKGK